MNKVRSIAEKYLSGLLKRYVNRYIVLLADVVVSTAATSISLLFFEIAMKRSYEFAQYALLAGISVIVSIIAFLITRSYAGVVRHTSMRELWRSFFASFIKAITVYLIIMTSESVRSQFDFSYNGALIFSLSDMIMTLFFLILMRIFITNLYSLLVVSSIPEYYIKNVLIYGTDDESVSTLNYLDKAHKTKYRCAGFITADTGNSDKLLCGYKVYHIDNPDNYARLISSKLIFSIIFPTSVQARREDDRMIKWSTDNRVQVLIKPLFTNLSSDMFGNRLREIKIEDLLGRDEIKINVTQIREFLTDKVVFVTGGAGSIGSELCRILVKMPIRKLILIDMAETPMHNMQLELRSQAPRVDKKFVVADVRNRDRVDHLFNKYKPNVVFHAAAYKHVPLMESNPCEAVQANITGTKNVVDASIKYNVEKFVMISTDKAVNPTNVMGCSKRIAEVYVQTIGKEIYEGRMQGKTKFITTRFGNVLGSNGSVIPLFKEQIAKGGPVTVTDPRVIRYFMTIPEACQLVLEAATMGNGNDIFVFDMGEPVKIVDLASKMIRLSGLQEGRDIEIQFVGLRPGEKLYEELLKDEENTLPTPHSKIFRARTRDFDLNEVIEKINKIEEMAASNNKDNTVLAMKQLIPEYKSENSRYERLDA